MKRLILLVLLVAAVAPSTGCCLMDRLMCRGGRGCSSCGDGDGSTDPNRPVAAVGYPYYTNRGPRDFLATNPRSIGP